MRNCILQGDALSVLATVPTASVQMCCTSPPYYGLRSYIPDGHPDKPLEIGLESSPSEYIAALVEVFREVRRVLRNDGLLWLNLGDSYAGSGKGGQSDEKRSENWQPTYVNKGNVPRGLKPKDLMMIPSRVAIALQEDGYYLRSDIIWHKPNAMPESVTDRPTSAHEHLFLLAKSERYYYDAEAIKELSVSDHDSGNGYKRAERLSYLNSDGTPRGNERGGWTMTTYRNKRNVWTVNSSPYAEAHFATFPPKLIEPCILAGSRPGDIVLDPFMGAGTTALVALQHGRDYLGIELNPEYVKLIEKRIACVQPNMWESEAAV